MERRYLERVLSRVRERSGVDEPAAVRGLAAGELTAVMDAGREIERGDGSLAHLPCRPAGEVVAGRALSVLLDRPLAGYRVAGAADHCRVLASAALAASDAIC